MRREPYFPRTTEARAEWFNNFATQLNLANGALGLPAATVAGIVADSREMHYACGAWIEAVKNFGPAAHSSLEAYLRGAEGAEVFALAGFNPPAREAGVAAVKAGALLRIFDFVQVIKRQPGYTEAMGLLLGIVGSTSAASEATAPEFTLKVEMGEGCQCVRIGFKKSGHKGVVIHGRRGSEPEFQMLGIDLATPFLDTRDLLAAGTPEIREYKLRFYDDNGATGDFSEVQRVNVGPG